MPWSHPDTQSGCTAALRRPLFRLSAPRQGPFAKAGLRQQPAPVAPFARSLRSPGRVGIPLLTVLGLITASLPDAQAQTRRPRHWTPDRPPPWRAG